MKKSVALVEMLVGLSTMALIIGLLLMSFKVVLNAVVLSNEAYGVKRRLEHARDYAQTYQINVMWKLSSNNYELVSSSGERISHYNFPRVVSVSGRSFSFTPDLKPSIGTTVIVRVGKKEKKIIVDPSTGRIRISP
ncbi:MAG: hypothetical protein AABZ14_01345 [Candidatus Margulisiibacteriota bacterium]